MKCLNPVEQETYKDFIKVFEREDIKNVKNIVKNLKGDGTMEPKKIIKTLIPAGEIARRQNQQAKIDFEKKPDNLPDINLNAKKPSIE